MAAQPPTAPFPATASGERVPTDAVNANLGALAQTMGIVITHAEIGLVTASMPVAGNTQPLGLLHGGANAVLAETTGSIASALHAAPTHYPVGIELGCAHHYGARSGQVHARATASALGSTLATHDIVIHDDGGRLLCTARLTCLLRPFER